MTKLATIGVPIYKRLQYLPHVLNVIAAQDYPNLELLISDNGMNGDAVQKIVAQHYHRPYRYRQNQATVSGSRHYNQLIQNAAGEYTVILADDDEISPNYVSELVRLLEKRPEASVAFGMEEVIDADGNFIRKSKSTVPEILSGPEFIRATWKTRKYGFEALCTFLGKTDKLRECGGFPDIWKATSDEDLLVVKMCVDNFVAFSTQCAFRKRFDEASQGYAIELRDLARGIREYLKCLDSEPRIKQYASYHPDEWNELRDYLIDSAGDTYYARWAGMYKKRLSRPQWIMAAFNVPVPRFYRPTAETVIAEFFPQTYAFCRGVKTKLRSMQSTS